MDGTHWSAATPPRASPPGRPRPSGARPFRDEHLSFSFAYIRARLRGNAGGCWRFVAIFPAALEVEVNVVEAACMAMRARRPFMPMWRSPTPARVVRRPDSLTFDFEDLRPLSTSSEGSMSSESEASIPEHISLITGFRGTRNPYPDELVRDVL